MLRALTASCLVAAFLEADHAKWSKVIKAANIAVE
jgi:hypothetical protein